jgi:hypothetical protein
LLIRAGLAALTVLVAAGAAQAMPPVWVVKDHDSEVVLFGSVHILPPNLEWRPPALAAALKDADDLWFELPMDPQSAAQTSQLAVQRGLMATGQSLFKLLGPKDAARLAKVAQDYGVSPALLDHLQPWMAEIALAGGAYKKAGADADDGVEKAVSAEAPASAQRRAFETPAEQIDMLSGGDTAEQLASLRETIQEMEDKPDEFAILVRAWMKGDISALDHEALKPLRKASPSLFKRLVTDRNARWAQILDQRLKGHGRTVVVVGVGHLIGPGSVPERLRALGYSVTGP